MNTPFTLRPVEEGDSAFLYQLYASARADELAAWGWPEPQRQAFLQMQFRAQQLSYQRQTPPPDQHIICSADQPIGRLILTSDAAALNISDIALLPEYRNRGIGSALIRQVITTATQSSRPVRLHVELHNPARHLYERLGFHIVANDGVYYSMEYSLTP